MITLQPIDETNFLEAAALQVKPEQRAYVAPAVGILARAYGLRCRRAVCWGICEDASLVGLALIHDLEEEPACYHLCEFLIDAKAQGKGCGQQALKLLLAQCRRERKFPRVEVCVKKENTAAIHVYEKAGFRDTGYVDPDAPDSLCLAYALPEKYGGVLDIYLSGPQDLANIQRLWADPAVMRYVGFPEGLHETMENLRERWLPWVQNPPKRQHYSVYAQNVGYCGESFYDVDETGLACLDIKLLERARGKGIAYAVLSHAITQAFCMGKAERVYVDPNPENQKAIALYAQLGFLIAKRPEHLDDPGCPYVYLEMTRQHWEARYGVWKCAWTGEAEKSKE